VIAELEKKYSFHVWEKVNEDQSAIRLVTSWATKEEEVVGFIEELKKWV
jgi:threonine aldolase